MSGTARSCAATLPRVSLALNPGYGSDVLIHRHFRKLVRFAKIAPEAGRHDAPGDAERRFLPVRSTAPHHIVRSYRTIPILSSFLRGFLRGAPATLSAITAESLATAAKALTLRQLSKHCRLEAIYGTQRSVANDPDLTLAVRRSI
jgi:hypothetical protein